MKSNGAKPSLRRSDTLRVQTLRYLIVGSIAFVVDYALLILLTEVALNYLVSAVVAFTAGLAVSYWLCTRYVFSVSSLSSRRIEFAIFAGIGVIGLGLTEVILWCGEVLLSVDYRVAKFVAVAIVLVWNFGVRRALLFRGGSHRGFANRNPRGNSWLALPHPDRAPKWP